MSSQQECPTPLQIQNWANGRHTSSEAEWLASHLERCEACVRRFAAIPNDEPLSRLVRQIGPELESEGDEHPSVRSLIEQLCQVAMPGELWGVHQPEDLLEPPVDPDEIGRLGAYRILERIGMGGMGVVFRAEDAKLSRPVALKILRPHLLQSDAVRSRFLSEARTAASLKHDHIVVIYQVGEVASSGSTVPFIAMEFLEGSSLTDWLQQNPRPPLDVVVRFGREIASGLVAAHSRGIIHRDIKPGNIWVEAVSDSGAARGPLPAGAGSLTRIRLLDFGLACTKSEDQTSVAGTPGYMAPEQSRGEAVDHRADLFALGCILSEMLERPASKSSPPGGASNLPPRRDSPAVSRRLHQLIGKLLAPSPADRPPSARAVEEELRSLEVQLARRSPSRWILVGTVLLLIATLSAAFWFWGRNGSVEVVGDRAVVVRRGSDEVARLTPENGWRSDLPPGHYTVDADDPEITVDPPRFTIRSGEVQRLMLSGPPGGAVGDEWLRYVAGLPADRQVNAVLAKLVELNPGFSGKCEFWAVQAGNITEFRVVTDSIRDISPVRGLPNLRVLACFGSKPGKGQLADLSPLRGMKFQALSCWHNPLSDLSPLRGMRLTEFQAEYTQIDSLTDLADMPIRTLTVQNTKVKDLSPVRNMPLWLCYVNGCPLSSLEPLTSTPVELLCCDYQPERDRPVLKAMPKLANINRLPTERFWREIELGRVPIP